MGETITVDNIPDNWCVASQGAAGKCEMWFSEWFVEQGFFDAPACSYKIEADKAGQWFVRQQFHDGRLRVWKLTGYEHPFDHSWLGVWPD